MATQAYCARLLGISERRFRELIDEGVIPRAAKSDYDVEVIVPAYCNNLRAVAAGRGGVEKSDADARLAAAKAENAEIDLAEKKGLLIPADQIADALHGAVVIMKTRLEGIPPKAAPLAHAAPSVPAAEKILRDHINEALAELGKVEVKGPSGPA